jgi:hypothetical protein
MTNDMPTPYYGLLYVIDPDSIAWATKHQVPRVYLARDVEELLKPGLPDHLLDAHAIAEARDRFRTQLEFSQAYAEQMRLALLQLVQNPDPEVHRVAFHALMPVSKVEWVKMESSDVG